jgi:hypothetical protein
MLLIPVLNGNAQQSVSRTIQDNNAYMGTSYAENTIYSIDTTSLNSKLPIPIQLGKNKRFRNTNAYILDDSSLNMNPTITHGVFKHNGIWKKNTALFSLPTLETESIFKATTGSSMAASIMSQNCACPSVNPPNSTGDKAFCAGSSIPPISVSVATNETVDWYDAPTAGNLIASNNISYQANQSGTYYAETRNTIYGYKSNTRTAVSLTQNDLPNLSL